uniref:THD domain-containing protein n=1 Tax=Salarias fasciatus TaxID=181472 RepID=A0A672H8N4_SALFA
FFLAPVKRSIHGNRLNWENEKGDAFCRGGFNCSNWELVVPKKGIYRVFLQVTWRQPECAGNELLFKVEVIVFSDTYRQDRVVLSMFDTVTCRTYLTKSLFGSKFLKLTPNSRLHVNSTFPSLITSSEHEVFFGAELTDESPQ